jgi:glycerol-3-phosphate O-acyltransferase
METATDSPIPALEAREARRHLALGDDQLEARLAETIYLERRRFHEDRGRLTEGDKRDAIAIEKAADTVGQGREAQADSLVRLARRYAREIHNDFSEPTYRLATRLMPKALLGLLTAASPKDLLGTDFDPGSRFRVHGPLERIKALAKTHTLLLAPTHVSNLDSPILGYALHSAGLPPFAYGAGLNLFENPAMAFFMSRLGAYTVDRRKRGQIYKDVLKDYSIEMIGRGYHSLFFPGGTRSRAGRIESTIKKGLLGTGIVAWQDGLEAGAAKPEVLVVPCTLSFSMVLEAETLIEDALAAEGKSRYIISDDEFSQPGTVAAFATKVLNMDASAIVRFGEPMDLFGHPVDDAGRSLDAQGTPFDRRAYVTDGEGAVVRDPQRDRAYTARLAQSICQAYRRDNTVLSTHLVAKVAWELLRAQHPGRDDVQVALTGDAGCRLAWTDLLAALDRATTAVEELAAAGQIHEALPAQGKAASRAEAILELALARFARFHSRPVLAPEGDALVVAPRLALYYANRLAGYGLLRGNST